MTKKYGDEAIIKMRRAYQKLKYNSLSTGIFVKEQLISFREQEIDSLGTRMILPEVMEPMEEEMKNGNTVLRNYYGSGVVCGWRFV